MENENGALLLEVFFQPTPHKKLTIDAAAFCKNVQTRLDLPNAPATLAEAIICMKSCKGKSDPREIALTALHDAGINCDRSGEPAGGDTEFQHYYQNVMKKDAVGLLARIFEGFDDETLAQNPAVITQTSHQTAEAATALAAPSAPAASLQHFGDEEWIRFLGKAQPKKDIHLDKRNSFTIYRGLAVTAEDDFYIELPSSLSVEDRPAPEAPVALFFTDDEGRLHIAAHGHLVGTSDRPRIVLKRSGIHEREFRGNSTFGVAILCAGSMDAAAAGQYDAAFYLMTKYHDVRMKDTKDVQNDDRMLCIDFGTSNTTAGSYGILDEAGSVPEMVAFPDVTDIGDDGLPKLKPMLPTIVYVKSCDSETGKIRYAFGYEAEAAIVAKDYAPEASVFHEIKSWEGVLDEKELDFKDEKGHSLEEGVSRRAILKAYLMYVIQTAEQHFHYRFHKLHFSAPVKLKDSFLQELAKTFPEYEIVPASESIDEGVAIVYDHISRARQWMENQPVNKETTNTIVIFDCGGGTTDLAQCEYTLKKISDDTQELHITTRSEGGNSNFGGNNITYRIFQLLKIKIVDHLQSESTEPRTVQELIPATEEEIMWALDKASLDKKTRHPLPPGLRGKAIGEAKEKLYQTFRDAYEASDNQVPTLFGEEDSSDRTKRWKRNFYYLWQMAEDIKIQFFRAANIVDFDFSSIDDRAKLQIDDSSYHLDVWKDGKLQPLSHPMEHVSVTIKEVNRLICPDLYALMLELFTDDLLRPGYYYKLSGQSCKISLFRDLMKEFIPGRSFRRNPENTAGTDAERKKSELKMACVRGCIQYFIDKHKGVVDPKIETDPPKLFYRVCRKNVKNNVALMGDADGRPQTHLLFFATSGAREATFYVEDPQGKKSVKDFRYSFVLKHSGEEAVYEDYRDLADALKDVTYLEKAAPGQLEDVLSNLERSDKTPVNYGEARQALLVLPAKSGYGFLIVQIEKAVDKAGVMTLSKMHQEFRKFQEEARAFFFDGRRHDDDRK